MQNRIIQPILIFSWIFFCFLVGGFSQGIPEPSLVLYGTVMAQTEVGDVRLTSGTIAFQVRPSAGGAAITIRGDLVNINDQFSYVLYVPLETKIPGVTVSANTLGVDVTPASFDRSSVVIDGQLATFVDPALRTFSLTSRDRGRYERIDLTVRNLCPDTDRNLLPDCWEREHFGFVGVDPLDDADGDGVNNLNEFKAGTDPRSTDSFLQFVHIEARTQGVYLEWSGLNGVVYSLLRSNELLTGYEVIASNIPANVPVTQFMDTTAEVLKPGVTYFYVVRTQP